MGQGERERKEERERARECCRLRVSVLLVFERDRECMVAFVEWLVCRKRERDRGEKKEERVRVCVEERKREMDAKAERGKMAVAEKREKQ